jgi:hypothetical protein
MMIAAAVRTATPVNPAVSRMMLKIGSAKISDVMCLAFVGFVDFDEDGFFLRWTDCKVCPVL